MARSLLSVKAIQAAKPATKEYLVSDGGGLFLRVLPSGKKTWQFIYSHGQRRKKMSLGDVDAVGLAAARCRANDERQRIAAGDDPRLAQFAREAEQAQELAEVNAEAERRKSENLSVKAMFEAWLADGVTRADGNAELLRSFGKDVLPVIGAKPVREVTESDIRDLLRRVGRSRGRSRTAVLMLADLRQLFRWAEKRKPWRPLLVEGNPAELVEAKQVVQTDYDLANERDRILSRDEIRALRDSFTRARCIYESARDRRTAVRPLCMETQLAIWIMLSTCCRVGELSSARWEDVNLQTGEWLVPRANTKTRVEWMVFLSDFSLRQFKSLHAITSGSSWCFPGRDPLTAISPKSISKQIGDRQFQFKGRTRLKNRRNDNALVLPGGEWTAHDLRRTGSTIMQSLGVPEHVRERCLNHVVGGKLGRIYGRHEFSNEKREAWRMLGDYLDAALIE
ncbi:MAG: tyrosine-type recombinase/integrase [Betaproteobacteria bacterium]|nr:tyrosine-type recombinase/integrase [Betaproteobacteria bacterium]MCU0767927.1 tyrosine-type recombinase/integrase [Burkholderiaceae bacterium]